MCFLSLKRNMGLTPLALLIGICLASLGSCQGPPKITGSYRAFGEIVETLPATDTEDITLQMHFEENYDADTGDSEFAVKELGNVVMFLENKRANQTFQFIHEKGEVSQKCMEVSVEEWVKTDSPPSLSRYEGSNGGIRFSLGQLFALDDENYLKETNIPSEIRGIPANKFVYEFKGDDNGTEVTVAIYAYWSIPKDEWELAAIKGISIPLGFVINKFFLDEKDRTLTIQEQVINVYGFLRDSVDKLVFQAHQGVICPNRRPTIKFPEIKNFRAVSFHAEIVLPDYSEIKTVDGWFDSTNKLLRLNMDRIKDASVNNRKTGQKWVSEVISGTLGAVFRITSYKGKAECKVSALKDYEFDVQDIINPKLSDWSLQNVFGLSDTNYVYIGKATKRNIPCYVFQAVRKDWPETSAGVTSLWEWCIAMHIDKSDDNVIFRDNELPLVNLEVKILESISKSAADYPADFKLVHHFYDVKVEDPGVMDLASFDINYCFGKDNRKDLQFAIDVAITTENSHMVEDATSDVTFLQSWKNQIAMAADLSRETLRISKVQSNVIVDKLFVRFTLLGLHTDLPEESKSGQKSLAEAEASLKSVIDDGNLQIKFMLSNSSEIHLTATKKSLTEQVNKTLIDQVPTPTPPDPVTEPSSEKPTGSPITMVTDPSDFTLPKSSSSVVTDSSESTSPKSSSSVVTDSSESTSPKSSSSVVTDSSESTSPKLSSSVVTDSSESTSPKSSSSVVTDSNESTSPKSSSSVVTDSNESTSPKSSSSVVTDSNESTSPKSSSSVVTDSNDATSSTSPPTKVTDPNNFSSTQSPTVVLSGHQPGTVAAVTIIMLLVGIGLGSGGTFVKFKGMPSFRRR